MSLDFVSDYTAVHVTHKCATVFNKYILACVNPCTRNKIRTFLWCALFPRRHTEDEIKQELDTGTSTSDYKVSRTRSPLSLSLSLIQYSICLACPSCLNGKLDTSRLIQKLYRQSCEYIVLSIDSVREIPIAFAPRLCHPFSFIRKCHYNFRFPRDTIPTKTVPSLACFKFTVLCRVCTKKATPNASF